MDSTAEFTIYGGVIIITFRTNVKTCYTCDQGLLPFEVK